MKSSRAYAWGVLWSACLLGSGSHPAVATQPADPVVCTENSPNTCSDTQKPDWEVAKEQADKAWDACEPDVEKFCEGVQAGANRVERCLDAHAVELSSGCAAARAHP